MEYEFEAVECFGEGQVPIVVVIDDLFDAFVLSGDFLDQALTLENERSHRDNEYRDDRLGTSPEQKMKHLFKN